MSVPRTRAVCPAALGTIWSDANARSTSFHLRTANEPRDDATS